jgi:hypothetical protein
VSGKLTDKPIVLVVWVDSHGGGSWQHFVEVPAVPLALSCETIGRLIAESDTAITIAHSVGDRTDFSEAQVCGTMTIPKLAVISRKTLKIDA